MDLTPKQQRFVEEYLIDLNGSAAYQRAGYKAKGNAAETAASRLLRNVQVKAALAAARRERSGRTDITQDYVLRRLQDNVERALQAEPACDREGNPVGQYTYQGGAANGALKLLGLHLGMFGDAGTLRQIAELEKAVDEIRKSQAGPGAGQGAGGVPGAPGQPLPQPP